MIKLIFEDNPTYTFLSRNFNFSFYLIINCLALYNYDNMNYNKVTMISIHQFV